MKLIVLKTHDVNSEIEDDPNVLNREEEIALIYYKQRHPEFTGYLTHIERRPVSFGLGSSLLFHVYRDIYRDTNTTLKVGDPYWMTDDFYEYVEIRTGKPLFYCHWAHGDCSHTWFEAV